MASHDSRDRDASAHHERPDPGSPWSGVREAHRHRPDGRDAGVVPGRPAVNVRDRDRAADGQCEEQPAPPTSRLGEALRYGAGTAEAAEGFTLSLVVRSAVRTSLIGRVDQVRSHLVQYPALGHPAPPQLVAKVTEIVLDQGIVALLHVSVLPRCRLSGRSGARRPGVLPALPCRLPRARTPCVAGRSRRTTRS